MHVRIVGTRLLLPGAVLMLVVVLAPAGCGGQKPGSSEESANVVTLQAEEAAILAAADKGDGQEDKVVANCGGCALGMLGRAEYALTAGDYEMHFCSEDCKTRFGANLVASIQGLKPSGR